MPSPLLEILKKADTFDKSLFFSLNGAFQWLDPFWIFWSSPWPWILAGIITFIYTGRRLPLKTWMVVALFAGLTFLVTDQTANWVKNNVRRPRPCRAFPAKTHRTWPRCSEFGFFSGHAANAFGQALFWGSLFTTFGFHGGRSKPFQRVLILWAALVALSRIFVGVHYPGDVLAGALVGLVVARLARWATLVFLNKIGIFTT
ncbi:MAG: phosphatase PAP2 family protein [Flavobacteriales bacterium]|nr:phosphatase PAP2 family protein [Flavobacteriales bacterium]